MEESVTISIRLYDSLKISEQVALKIIRDQEYFYIRDYNKENTYCFFITKDETLKALNERVKELEDVIYKLKYPPPKKKQWWKRL